MKTRTLQHCFVKYIPDPLEDGVLYISIDYSTAMHKCMCGCGNKVVTPFSPRDWAMTFDGETVSLSPSIGNWSFECQSHYWIKRDRIEWAGQWSKSEIKSGREKDKIRKKAHFEEPPEELKQNQGKSIEVVTEIHSSNPTTTPEQTIWDALSSWFKALLKR
jgi:hypothetical protein